MTSKGLTRIALLTAAALSVTAGGAALADATAGPNTPPPPPIKGGPPAPRPAADMQAVLDAQQALGAKPIETLTPAQARLQPTVADGAKAVMRRMGMSTAPDPAVSSRDVVFPITADGSMVQKARIYTPVAARGGQALPVILYFHGGGFVLADLDVYDAAPRAMSKALNAVVISAEYRHAPEAKFPAQHEDAAAAYRWVLKTAPSLGGDPRRVALAGESAGGLLAVATAIYARDNGLPAPRHVLAVYPIANSDTNLPSKREEYNAKPLNTPMLAWFSNYYSRSPADDQDPRINLVKANLAGLPPTTIVNAQLDPLRSDGETLAAAMRLAGDQVEQKTFPGVTHEFFGTANVVGGAAEANRYAFARLGAALGTASAR